MNILFNESEKTIILDLPGVTTKITLRVSSNNRVTAILVNDEIIGIVYLPIMKVVRILRKGISGYLFTFPKAILNYE